jgi:O-antigen/teichoic acid export membrane protein
MLKFGGENILRLGSNLILTRLLFPEAFGLMALVTVFLTGLKMFSDFGLNASIIRSARGDDPIFLQTAWTVQILRGVMLWLISVMLAGPGRGLLRRAAPGTAPACRGSDGDHPRVRVFQRLRRTGT